MSNRSQVPPRPFEGTVPFLASSTSCSGQRKFSPLRDVTSCQSKRKLVKPLAVGLGGGCHGEKLRETTGWQTSGYPGASIFKAVGRFQESAGEP